MEMIIKPLIGGVLIGLGSIVLMLFSGRIAGISGIAGGLMARAAGSDLSWRIAFIVGLILGPLLISLATGSMHAVPPQATMGVLIAAGILVGVGTSIGAGCTSGHGVCGISRLSVRSIIATVTFILVAGITVYITQHLL